MLHKLWALHSKLGWDHPIPKVLREDWVKFFQEFKDLDNVSFDRSIKPEKAINDPVLVIFSDGSGEAYGAAAYARWQLEDQSYSPSLIMAKNRIAPIKIVDIVRLEISGAVISKRLHCFIQEELRYQFEKVYHIFDSEIVKAMISKESYVFNTFAANRIGEIQSMTEVSKWYRVNGTLNIANWITRGKSPVDLQSKSVWQEGPAFLRLPVESWPILSHAGVTDLPERIKAVFVGAVDGAVLETLESRIDIKHFSKFQLLINTTARVIKLYEQYSRLKQETAVKQYIPEITPDDQEKAKKLWVVDSQKQLKASVDEGKYVRLCPRYENGVIVVGGRTERWMSSTWNRQNFVLLPHDHHLAYLIVLYKHQQGGHLGVAATISRVRMKYWILNIRMLTKKIVGSCVKCREKLKRFTEQVMNSLPIERMQQSSPFFTVGIDFFGPYTIRGEVQKRTRKKCFGVIIACNVSRTVYVDISHNYSTDAFLQVLRWFSSLRGWPRKIHSDNGTQLVAASKELINTVKDLDWDMIKRYVIKYKTEWEFSPADAPWQNGATEALIKPIKRALKNAIEEEVMSFSELQAVMFEAAQLVNQRPIGAHRTSPEENPYAQTTFSLADLRVMCHKGNSLSEQV